MKPEKPPKRRRNSLRWQGQDYSDPGSYYLTICTYQRELWLSDIVNGKVWVSRLGKIAQNCWELLPNHYRYVQTEAFVLMPNHLHAILTLADRTDANPRHGISEMMRWFKGLSARFINEQRGSRGAQVWQRSFYDSVIKHPRMYDFISQYIYNNPLQWDLDRLHPNHPNPFPMMDE
jgi:putative transposase